MDETEFLFDVCLLFRVLYMFTHYINKRHLYERLEHLGNNSFSEARTILVFIDEVTITN
jgi:hypothetical protein